MRQLSLFVSFLAVFVVCTHAQDRIKGPDFAPWIRKTVDLTNHIPKTFRCSYKKRCKAEQEKAKTAATFPRVDLKKQPSPATKSIKENLKTAIGKKVDAYKKQMEKKVVNKLLNTAGI